MPCSVPWPRARQAPRDDFRHRARAPAPRCAPIPGRSLSQGPPRKEGRTRRPTTRPGARICLFTQCAGLGVLAHPQATEHQADRGDRPAQERRDLGPRPPAAPQPLNPAHHPARHLMRAAAGPTRPIQQPGAPLPLPAPHPLPDGPGTHPKGRRHRRPPLPLLHDPLHQQGSPRRRQLRILMHVPWGLRLSLLGCLATPSFAYRAPVNNLLSNYS